MQLLVNASFSAYIRCIYIYKIVKSAHYSPICFYPMLLEKRV